MVSDIRTRSFFDEVFNYNSTVDSVLHVTTRQYNAYNTSSPITSYKGGKTVFTLPHESPFHFISGNQSNYQKGENLIVVVLAPQNGSHGSPTSTVAASLSPSTVAYSPSFTPAPASTPTHKAPSSSSLPAPVVSAPSPSSSPASIVLVPYPSSSPAPVIPIPSPSSFPAPVIPVLSPSLSPTPSVSDSSPSSSPALSPPPPSTVTTLALQNMPTTSPPPLSASPLDLVSAKNLVIPLVFLALKILY